MPSDPTPRRIWNVTLHDSASITDARRILEARGYVRRESGSDARTYSEWYDVDPRSGSTSSDFHVVEDPASPVIDELEKRFNAPSPVPRQGPALATPAKAED